MIAWQKTYSPTATLQICMAMLLMAEVLFMTQACISADMNFISGPCRICNNSANDTTFMSACNAPFCQEIVSKTCAQIFTDSSSKSQCMNNPQNVFLPHNPTEVLFCVDCSGSNLTFIPCAPQYTVFLNLDNNPNIASIGNVFNQGLWEHISVLSLQNTSVNTIPANSFTFNGTQIFQSQYGALSLGQNTITTIEAGAFGNVTLHNLSFAGSVLEDALVDGSFDGLSVTGIVNFSLSAISNICTHGFRTNYGIAFNFFWSTFSGNLSPFAFRNASGLNLSSSTFTGTLSRGVFNGLDHCFPVLEYCHFLGQIQTEAFQNIINDGLNTALHCVRFSGSNFSTGSLTNGSFRGLGDKDFRVCLTQCTFSGPVGPAVFGNDTIHHVDFSGSVFQRGSLVSGSFDGLVSHFFNMSNVTFASESLSHGTFSGVSTANLLLNHSAFPENILPMGVFANFNFLGGYNYIDEGGSNTQARSYPGVLNISHSNLTQLESNATTGAFSDMRTRQTASATLDLSFNKLTSIGINALTNVSVINVSLADNPTLVTFEHGWDLGLRHVLYLNTERCASHCSVTAIRFNGSIEVTCNCSHGVFGTGSFCSFSSCSNLSLQDIPTPRHGTYVPVDAADTDSFNGTVPNGIDVFVQCQQGYTIGAFNPIIRCLGGQFNHSALSSCSGAVTCSPPGGFGGLSLWEKCMAGVAMVFFFMNAWILKNYLVHDNWLGKRPSTFLDILLEILLTVVALIPGAVGAKCISQSQCVGDGILLAFGFITEMNCVTSLHLHSLNFDPALFFI